MARKKTIARKPLKKARKKTPRTERPVMKAKSRTFSCRVCGKVLKIDDCGCGHSDVVVCCGDAMDKS